MQISKRNLIYLTVQILSGLLSLLSFIGIFLAKTDEQAAQYSFNFSQAILMFAVTFVPLVLKKNIRLAIPAEIQVIFLIFCICHFILGEIGEFYLHVPHWDSMLHFLGGILTAIFGFCLVGVLNNSNKSNFHLSPVFLAIFAVCFTVTVGVVWEIYEFASDCILGSNMQRYMDSVTGEIFIGQEALKDTMKDLILETCSAIGVAVIFIVNSSFRSRVETYSIERLPKKEKEVKYIILKEVDTEELDNMKEEIKEEVLQEMKDDTIK